MSQSSPRFSPPLCTARTPRFLSLCTRCTREPRGHRSTRPRAGSVCQSTGAEPAARAVATSIRHYQHTTVPHSRAPQPPCPDCRDREPLPVHVTRAPRGYRAHGSASPGSCCARPGPGWAPRGCICPRRSVLLSETPMRGWPGSQCQGVSGRSGWGPD